MFAIVNGGKAITDGMATNFSRVQFGFNLLDYEILQ
jgi:hypothetical protein